MRGSRRSSTQPGSGWKLSETDTRVCGFARLGRPSERSLVLQGSLPDEWPTLAGERTHGSVTLSSRNAPSTTARRGRGGRFLKLVNSGSNNGVAPKRFLPRQSAAFKVLRNDRAKFDLDEFLSRPLLAHLSTSSEEGARNSVFWYLWEEGALWVIVEDGYNTAQDRVRDDSRVAVGIVDFDPKTGFLQHVSIRGKGSLEPWNHDRASRLLRRYYAHLDGYVAPPRKPGEPTTGRRQTMFLRVTPKSVLLRDQAYRASVLASVAKKRAGQAGHHPSSRVRSAGLPLRKGRSADG